MGFYPSSDRIIEINAWTLRSGTWRWIIQQTNIPPTMGQLAIVDTSNSAHGISSVASNGDMHVDQDAKHNMELNNTLPPHQPIITSGNDVQSS